MSEERISMAEKLQANFDKYKPAVEASVDALDDTIRLLKALKKGDREAVESRLTKWRDVNETLAAIGALDAPEAADAADDSAVITRRGPRAFEAQQRYAAIAEDFAGLASEQQLAQVPHRPAELAETVEGRDRTELDAIQAEIGDRIESGRML